MENTPQPAASGQTPQVNDITLIEIENRKLDLEIEKMKFWSKLVGDNLPRVLDYFQARLLRHDVPVMKTGIWVLSVIVFSIVLGTGVLVYLGKLDSATFTFVIGTVLGYLLSFSKVFLKNGNQ